MLELHCACRIPPLEAEEVGGYNYIETCVRLDFYFNPPESALYTFLAFLRINSSEEASLVASLSSIKTIIRCYNKTGASQRSKGKRNKQ